jgi:tRNA isopentenyl-2-thiomethyl-A-37 hydroxylase MiaE
VKRGRAAASAVINDEIRMTNAEGMMKSENRHAGDYLVVIRASPRISHVKTQGEVQVYAASSLIGHWSFVIRH